MRLSGLIGPRQRPGFPYAWTDFTRLYPAEAPRFRQSAIALCALSVFGLTSPATASEPVVNFNLPSQRLPDALLELAVQARTPLGGDLSACQGRSPPVRGAMTVRSALTRLLDGSDCVYVLRPDRSVIIRRAPRRQTSTAPTPEVARPDGQGDAALLSDIIVTAQRRPASPQNTPSAVTSISTSQIESTGVEDANDLSTLVAGMTVTNLGSGRNKVLLRGMSDGAFTGLTQSTVGIYLNRAPLTYNAPDPDLKLIDLDRIEVLRGPQGAQYGAGPIGGILRIVPRSPDPGEEVLEVSASRSTTHGGGANSDYSAIVNLPLPIANGALRAALYAEDSGGYINDVSLNLRRVNEGSRRGARVSIAFEAVPDWTVGAGGTWQRIETQDTHYIYRILGGFRRANLVREPHANDFTEAHLSVEGRGDWGRFDAMLSHVGHNFDSRYDASVALGAFGSNGRIGALDESRRIDLSVAEAVYASPSDARLRWLVGAFASSGETHATTDLWTLWPFRARTYSEGRTDRRSEIAVFGEASYDLSPDLTLIAGGRVFGIISETSSTVVQGGRTRPFEGEDDQRGFSPKLALDYRADSRWSYYAQVAQGHRVGGFNTAGPIGQPFGGRVGEPARRYEGDTLWNFEVGAKGRLWDGRVQTRLALFRAYWKDIQSDQFLPSGLAYAVNVGDGANTGLEMETNWRPGETLELRANALFSDPEITNPSPSFNSRGDAGLPGVPAISANVNLAWAREWRHGLTLTANANVAYVGASRLTFDAARRHRMGDYVTGRLAAGVSAEHWRINAFVDNPLDTAANTFAFGDPFRLPEALATTPLRPRTVGVTLTVNR